MKRIISCWVALLFVGQWQTQAWNAAGHMTTAAFAYRQLDTQTRAAVDALLRKHPDYKEFKRGYRSGQGYTQAAYAFMRASVWADDIRRSGNPFDHPNWHFVDYQVSPPQTSPVGPSPMPNDDVLYGLQQCEDILGDAALASKTRAVHLAWIIHLIGDSHQPLHCATLINNTYAAPLGDKGGNDFFIRPAQKGIKLHSFWDGLIGSSTDARDSWNNAIALETQFPRNALPELTAAAGPTAWSVESREAAISAAYKLSGLEGHDSAGKALSVDSTYTGAAKSLAERRVALAGYRLADKLTALLE